MRSQTCHRLLHTLLSNAGSLLLQHGCHGCCCPATVGNQGPSEPTQTDGDECKATSFSDRHFTLRMCRYILVPDSSASTSSEHLSTHNPNSTFSDVTVVMETSRRGLSVVFFFFPPDTRNLLVSFIWLPSLLNCRRLLGASR